jgi:hypothetical protein
MVLAFDHSHTAVNKQSEQTAVLSSTRPSPEREGMACETIITLWLTKHRYPLPFYMVQYMDTLYHNPLVLLQTIDTIKGIYVYREEGLQ